MNPEASPPIKLQISKDLLFESLKQLNTSVTANKIISKTREVFNKGEVLTAHRILETIFFEKKSITLSKEEKLKCYVWFSSIKLSIVGLARKNTKILNANFLKGLSKCIKSLSIDKNYRLFAYYIKACYYFNKDFSKCQLEIEKSIKYIETRSERPNEKGLKVYLYLMLGKIKFANSNYKQAIEYYKKTLFFLYEFQGDKKRLELFDNFFRIDISEVMVVCKIGIVSCRSNSETDPHFSFTVKDLLDQFLNSSNNDSNASFILCDYFLAMYSDAMRKGEDWNLFDKKILKKIREKIDTDKCFSRLQNKKSTYDMFLCCEITYICYLEKNYQKCFEISRHVFENIEYLDSKKDKEKCLWNINVILGGIMRDTKNFDMSIKFFKKACEYKEIQNNYPCSELANIYYQQKKYHKLFDLLKPLDLSDVFEFTYTVIIYAISAAYQYKEKCSSTKEPDILLTQFLSKEISEILNQLIRIYRITFDTETPVVKLRDPKRITAETTKEFLWTLIYSLFELADISKSRNSKGAEIAYQCGFNILEHIQKSNTDENDSGIFKNFECMEKTLFLAKNNYASILHKNGNFEKAFELHSSIVDKIETFDKEKRETEFSKKLHFCSKINMTLILESLRHFHDAREQYQELLKEAPNCILVKTRSGIVEEMTQNYSKAEDYYQDVIRACSSGMDVEKNLIYEDLKETLRLTWLRLGCLQMRKNELKSAQKSFEYVMTNIDQHDLLGLLCLGELYCFTARAEVSNEGKKHLYSKAKRFFVTALKVNTHCPYAVNGLAVICADSGMYIEATRILSELIGSLDAPIKEIYLNLAQCLIETGRFEEGLELMERSIEWFSLYNDPDVLLMHCRALFIISKFQKSYSKMERCFELLMKILDMNPSNSEKIKYNIALAKQTYAKILSDKEYHGGTTIDFLKALEWLNESSKEFDELYKEGKAFIEKIKENKSKNIQSENLYYDPKVAKHRAEYSSVLEPKINEKYKKRKEIEPEYEEEVRKYIEYGKDESKKYKPDSVQHDLVKAANNNNN